MFLYGLHPCKAALANPNRKIEKIFITNASILEKLPPIGKIKVEILDRKALESRLPVGAVHQGIALSVQPLLYKSLEDIEILSAPNQCVIVLDQVSDPHNVGAILRSAAVFNASAVITTGRHAPSETGTLAKSASGALEIVPLCTVSNLSQAIETLKEMNFWCVGLAESGEKTLDKIDLSGKIALIMGGEGEGMRYLTKKKCDFIVRLSTSALFSTLNVSNAAAISLYEVFKQQNSNL